jgi:two-component system sensor histidine kinase and response regulator WspE
MTADLEASQRRLSGICEQLYRVAQASRMRPFSDGVQAFPRMVRDLARSLGKKIAFRIEGEDAPVDRDILEKLESPLTHLLRNSVDHGVEAPQARAAAGKPEEGTVTLSARHSGGNLAISISDDGAGIDAEALKKTIIEKGLSTARMLGGMSEAELFEFMFLPGFSTKKEVTEISGRGVGLDVVRSMLREVGGSVQVVSKAGAGARFEMSLPLTLSVIRALIVEIDGDPYAFALSRVESCLKVGAGEIMLAGEHPYISHLGQSIGIAEARDLLGFSPRSGETGTRSLVVISGGSGRLAICVDRFVGERDIVVRPLGALLGKVPDVLAASITEDGAPLLILDVDDFARSAHRHLSKPQAAEAEGDRHEGGGEKSKRILVVDDSLTVREVERRLLEGRGYAVDVAVDGAEAWNAVRSRSYDLVVTDVDMPRLNGIELVRLIKGDPRLSLMPVMIVSYKDSQEDRMKGLDAGASYYFNKGSFDDDRLLTAISDLIGDA